jgi:hypothetical protein
MFASPEIIAVRPTVPMDQSKISACIETLCEKGCREVTRVIGTLEQRGAVEEAATLTDDERNAVLVELKSIMAVYGRS